MTITARDTFTAGTAGQSLTARAAETGTWLDNGYWFWYVDGAGKAIPSGFNNYAWMAGQPTTGTMKVTLQPDAAGAGILRAWLRGNAGISTGYALAALPGGAGTELLRNGSQVGLHTTGYTAGAPCPYWVTFAVEGGSSLRINVWVAGNTGTPDISYLDTSPITGTHIGLESVGGSQTQPVDVIEVDDVVTAPGGGSIPPLESPAQVRSRRLRGHPLRTLTLRGFGPAVGVPVYDIVCGTSLGLSGDTAVVPQPRLSSATMLGTTGSTAPIAQPVVAAATSLSLSGASSARLDALLALATSLQLSGASAVRFGSSVQSATSLLLSGSTIVLFDLGAPVYVIEAATQLQLTGAIGMTFGPAIASATALALAGAAAVRRDQAIVHGSALTLAGSTLVAPSPRIASATALAFAQAADVRPGAAITLATVLGLSGSALVRLAPAIVQASALGFGGATNLRVDARISSATQLLLQGATSVLFDIGLPVYVIESATQLQLTGAIGMTFAPAVAGASALGLAGGTLITRDPAIAAGTVLTLDGRTLVRPNWRIESATVLRLAGNVLLVFAPPGAVQTLMRARRSLVPATTASGLIILTTAVPAHILARCALPATIRPDDV